MISQVLRAVKAPLYDLVLVSKPRKRKKKYQVKVRGVRISKHYTKTAAKKAAKRSGGSVSKLPKGYGKKKKIRR